MSRALAVALMAFLPLAWAQDMKTATLYANKIYCDACAAVITKALRNVPGVSKIDVNVESKEVVVHYDPSKATAEDLTAATAKKGFPSTVRSVQ